MAFKFRQRQVEDSRAQENFEQLEATLDGHGNSIDKALLDRRLWGQVTSAGVKAAGSTGWTVARNALGSYTVTFSPVFSATPAPAGSMPTAFGVQFQMQATTSALNVQTFNATGGGAQDAAFHFVVVGLA